MRSAVPADLTRLGAVAGERPEDGATDVGEVDVPPGRALSIDGPGRREAGRR